MAAYNSVATFGSLSFNVSDVTVKQKPSTLKTNLGKTYVSKSIPLRNTVDKVLTVNGVITGLSRTSGQTQATAIENDRTTLLGLDDGYYHTYDDGRHSGNYVIVPNSLTFNDEAVRETGQPQKFSMELEQWQ